MPWTPVQPLAVRRRCRALKVARLIFLKEGEAAITRECAPADSVIDSPAVYEPSKAGLIRIVYQRNTYHGRKPGGIYLTGTDGKTVRIHTGAVESGAVSPDGCTLAFREVAPVGGRWQGVLKVMGVC